jgi:hypothetical protein
MTAEVIVASIFPAFVSLAVENVLGEGVPEVFG